MPSDIHKLRLNSFDVLYNSDLFWKHMGRFIHRIAEVVLLAFFYRLFHEDFPPHNGDSLYNIQ